MSVTDAHGERLAAISNAVVGIFAESYGRGPTKAKSYVFENYVLCVLEDMLTTVERTLVDYGEEALVRTVRLKFQEAVADRFKGAAAGGGGRATSGVRASPAAATMSCMPGVKRRGRPVSLSGR